MENSEPKTEYYLKSIDLVRSKINTPEQSGFSTSNLNYSIGIQTTLDAEPRTLTVKVSIDVISAEQTVFSEITVSNVYQIVNFEEAIKLNNMNQYVIPPKLLEATSSISYSTTRGVMYVFLKGTFLHNAIAPLIDPSQLKPQKLSE